MKGYSDLEQSKKLTEILPLESADMGYIPSAEDDDGNTLYTAEYKSEVIFDEDCIPCWSLAALLDALPRIEHLKPSIDLNPKLESNEVAIYYHSEDSPYIVRDNLIDAIFEMICWLKENNEL